MSKNYFLNVELKWDNLDLYVIRKSILSSIKKNLVFFRGEMVDIGCGQMPYRNYILENSKVKQYHGLDIENAKVYDENVRPDFIWDGKTMPFKDHNFDTAFATEVLEHCPYPNLILNETYRILKKDGLFFFTVPFLWNLHEVPNDEYRYTPFSLQRHLEEVGFKDIEIRATGGWHAAMAQMLGLWVRRSPMKENKRKILSKLFKPLIKKLLKLDKPDLVEFKEGQMITGLYGIAKK